MDRQEFWSAAMDGELSDEEFLALIEKEGCGEATTTWRQYRLMGDHLRHGQSQRCLCHKIMGAVEAQQKENPLAIPISVKHHLWSWVPKNFMGQTAVAAGALSMAVLLAFGGAVYFSPATQQVAKVNHMAATLPQQTTVSEITQSTPNATVPATLNATGSATHVANNADVDQSNDRQSSPIVVNASSRGKSLAMQQTIKLQPVATNLLAATDTSSGGDVAQQNASVDEMNFLHQVSASSNFSRPAFFLTDNPQQ